MEIIPPIDTRPCRFSVCLQEGSVFADFDVDGDGRVFVRRISFDGFGCCGAPERIGRMSVPHSRSLLEQIARGALDHAATESILRTYFRENADVLWPDALSDHELI